MKYLVCLSLLCLSLCAADAQAVRLGRLCPKARRTMLIRIARDVAQTLGPGYAPYFGTPIVSRPKRLTQDDYAADAPEVRRCLGRTYYTVTFPYDTAVVRFDFDFAAEVRIWKDTGAPLDVTFGNGMGRNFFSLSYEEQTRSPSETRVVPLQTSEEPESIWR